MTTSLIITMNTQAQLSSFFFSFFFDEDNKIGLSVLVGIRRTIGKKDTLYVLIEHTMGSFLGACLGKRPMSQSAVFQAAGGESQAIEALFVCETIKRKTPCC